MFVKMLQLPVPAQLMVKMSSIPGAGLGVFANHEGIARGVKFGPYVGKKVPASHVDEDTNTSYMWEVCNLENLTGAVGWRERK